MEWEETFAQGLPSILYQPSPLYDFQAAKVGPSQEVIFLSHVVL